MEITTNKLLHLTNNFTHSCTAHKLTDTKRKPGQHKSTNTQKKTHTKRVLLWPKHSARHNCRHVCPLLTTVTQNLTPMWLPLGVPHSPALLPGVSSGFITEMHFRQFWRTLKHIFPRCCKAWILWAKG
jgi:hypothetical protein